MSSDMKKVLKIAAISVASVIAVAAAIFLIYKLTEKREPLKAVDFVISYEDVTEEDRLTEEAYATLMDAVFEKMKKTDDPAVNAEKPDISFICHDGNGGNIKSYRVFRISARNRDYVIYSADEDTFYKVDTDTLDTFFDMPPIKEACLDAEIPRLILKTTVSEGLRALGAATAGEWTYADETGAFVTVTADEKVSDEAVELDFGLYDFCFICTRTPDKMTLTATDGATGEQTETDIYAGEILPKLEEGKTYTLTVGAEWEQTEDADFYGNISYVFSVTVTG